MPQTLLVPLDGSELGEAALPWAVSLARARGLGLVLTQVGTWPRVGTNPTVSGYLRPDLYAPAAAANWDAVAAYLDEIRRRLAGAGLVVETAVRQGDPVEHILDLADERGAYAIAMATYGRGGLGRLVLGSVVERVLQHATIPVLLVHTRPEGTGPPDTRTQGEAPPVAPVVRRLLVPLDGSPLAERALDVADEISADGTTLVLVRVAPPARRFPPDPTIRTTVTVEDEEAERRGLSEGEAYLDRVAHGLEGTGRAIERDVRVGSPAEEILATARDHAADLIVMATHGTTGPARWLLGSVADQVVRRAEGPVLLVSARALAARVAGPFAVRDVMTRDLVTIREDEPLIAVVRKLRRRRISGAPVVDASGELVGVISEHDLLEWQATLVDELAKRSSVAPAEYARRLETEVAREMMSAPAVTIDEAAPLSAAIRLFRERRLRRLPVTHEGRLVGIVSRADVLRAMAAQWEASAAGTAPDAD